MCCWGGHTIWSEVTEPESALILFQYLQQAEDLGVREKQNIKLLLLSKSLNITLLFLENGANIKTTNSDGNTILHETKDFEVALLGIDRGIDVNVKNNQNREILDLLNIYNSNY